MYTYIYMWTANQIETQCYREIQHEANKGSTSPARRAAERVVIASATAFSLRNCLCTERRQRRKKRGKKVSKKNHAAIIGCMHIAKNTMKYE